MTDWNDGAMTMWRRWARRGVPAGESSSSRVRVGPGWGVELLLRPRPCLVGRGGEVLQQRRRVGAQHHRRVHPRTRIHGARNDAGGGERRGGGDWVALGRQPSRWAVQRPPPRCSAPRIYPRFRPIPLLLGIGLVIPQQRGRQIGSRLWWLAAHRCPASPPSGQVACAKSEPNRFNDATLTRSPPAMGGPGRHSWLVCTDRATLPRILNFRGQLISTHCRSAAFILHGLRTSSGEKQDGGCRSGIFYF